MPLESMFSVSILVFCKLLMEVFVIGYMGDNGWFCGGVSERRVANAGTWEQINMESVGRVPAVR